MSGYEIAQSRWCFNFVGVVLAFRYICHWDLWVAELRNYGASVVQEETKNAVQVSVPRFSSDPAGMVGFCARRAQRALFQTHSALTDAVFYTNISSENTPNFLVVLLQIQPTMF